jgi:pantoate--beta-alanine ligase
MLVCTKITDLNDYLNPLREKGLKIGFVPTMGALHDGHITLIKKAKEESDIVVCSIFVNPTQFNDPEDLKNYPRTEAEDIKLLSGENCDVVFLPEEKEIYPKHENLPHLDFHFGELENVMEGKFRPGHFAGVAKVVSRLFDIVNPHKAFFGQKDYQQVAVINNLVKQTNSPVEIISCPTFREQDGLAYSSRNRFLTPIARSKAVIVPQALFHAKEMYAKESISTIKEMVAEKIRSTEDLSLEYFEISDSKTLLPLKEWNTAGNNVACIAVFAGKVRLIDNVIF